MSATWWGVLAAFFFTAGIGLLWPSRDGAPLYETALSLVGKSLLFSWGIVVASYWLKLPNLLPFLAFVTFAVSILRARRSQASIKIVGMPWHFLSALAVSIFVLICAQILMGVPKGEYKLIFQGWDAVVSWNRWAQDLFENDYIPTNGAYPVLFPGIWSLIYKAQGNSEVWIIAKLSLFLLPALVAVLVARLFEVSRPLSALAIAVVSVELLINRQVQALLSGYMDLPVFVMMLVSGTFLALAAYYYDDDRRDDAAASLLIGAIFAGLAAVTKQAGVIMLVPALVLSAYFVIKRVITLRVQAVIATVAIAPLLGFLTLYLTKQSSVIGNLSHLEGLSEGTYGSSWSVTVDLLSNVLPSPIIWPLLVLGLTNFAHLRSVSGLVGAGFCILSVAGFTVFSQCCAYDVRNGWWIFALLTCSAICGLGVFERWLIRRIEANTSRKVGAALIAPAILTLMAVGATAASYLVPDEKLAELQEVGQWGIVNPELAGLVSQHLDSMGPDGVVISAFQPLAWLPPLKGRYSFCYYQSLSCVEKIVKARPGSLVIVSSMNGTYYEDFRGQLSEDKLLGSMGVYQIYGPY